MLLWLVIMSTLKNISMDEYINICYVRKRKILNTNILRTIMCIIGYVFCHGNCIQIFVFYIYVKMQLWFFYDVDGTPSGIRYKNGDSINDYYFVCNWRGDVTEIYDSTGALAASYSYDAWGKVVSVTDATVCGNNIINPYCQRQSHPLSWLLLRYRDKSLLPQEQIL